MRYIVFNATIIFNIEFTSHSLVYLEEDLLKDKNTIVLMNRLELFLLQFLFSLFAVAYKYVIQ